MNIAWLLYYTQNRDTESLRTMNESRAFTLYARWRAVPGWASSLYAPVRRHLQRRAAQKILMTLSDHLLADIGMYRSGNIIAVVDVNRPSLVESMPAMEEKGTTCRCIILPTVPDTRDVPEPASTYFMYKDARDRLINVGAF